MTRPTRIAAALAALAGWWVALALAPDAVLVLLALLALFSIGVLIWRAMQSSQLASLHRWWRGAPD